MRWEKVVLVLGVTLLAGLLVAFVGCSSDEKSAGSDVDYNDPEFVVMQQEIDSLVDSILVFFTNGLGNIYGLPTDTTVDPHMYGPGPPDYDSTRDTATATYAGGWHVVYFAIHRDAYNAIMRDSIQFIKNGQPQQNSGGLDSLVYKHYWSYSITDTTVTHRAYTGNADYAFAGLDGYQVTINGTDDKQIHAKYVSTDSTVWRDINIEAALTDMVVNKTGSGWAQGCPNSGTIAASIEMVYQKDSAAPDSSAWSVGLTFSSGRMHGSVTRGTTTWPYSTQVCTSPY